MYLLQQRHLGCMQRWPGLVKTSVDSGMVAASSPTVFTVFLGRGICILLDTLVSNLNTSCPFLNLNFPVGRSHMEMNDGHCGDIHKQEILTRMWNMNFVLFRCSSKHILIMEPPPPPSPQFSLPRHVRKESLI